MTSPISSNWFYYMTMASMAQAMPSVNQTGSSKNQLSGTGNDNSLFMMLLNAAMQGTETNTDALNPLASNTEMLSQLTNSYNQTTLPAASTPLASSTDLLSQLSNSAALPNSIAKEAPASLNTKIDLNFKPVQFIKLENTLDGKLSGTATHFINAGKKYNLDPNLLSAIAMHETGNGSSRAVNEKNNVAGMMGRNGLRSYGSVEESIFDMARNLRENYVNQGKTTVAEIGAKYAPVGATNDPTGLNNHWTKGVSRQLNNLA